MRKGLKIAALASLAFVSITAVAVSTVAWFGCGGAIAFGTNADEVNVSGGSIAEHYKSGHGTEDDPYIIATRNHLYNLAWLQYLGFYNDPARNSVGIKQMYFEMDDEIQELDCLGLTLPPIGTEKFPFLSHFDGKGVVIKNFVISNDNPANAGSDFGVAKPSQLYNSQRPEIVGFFGVVGALPSQDITYTDSIVSIENVILKDFEVKSKTDATLIGLAAGYVDGTMSGVKVDGDATLNLGNTTKTAKSAITSNLTDYALVGYSTHTSGSGSYSQSVSTWYDAFNPDFGGNERPSLGGHSSVMEIYDRLNGISKSETHYAHKQTQIKYENGTFSNPVTTQISGSNVLHNYEDDENYVGSFCFSDQPSGLGNEQVKNISITGKRTVRRVVEDRTSGEKMLFANGYNNRYLPPRNNESSNVFTNGGATWEDNPSKENGWYITNPNFAEGQTGSLGAVYTVKDGVHYYLYLVKVGNNVYARQKVLSEVPTSPEYIWTISSTGASKTVNGNSYTLYNMSAKYNGTDYYLQSGSPKTNPSTNDRLIIRYRAFYGSYEELTDETDNYDTYFPLITEENTIKAAANNTGYVVSSSDYEPNPDLTASGAIQVSRYTQSGNFDYSAETDKDKIRTVYGSNSSDVLASSIGSYQEFSTRYDDFKSSVNNFSTYFYGMRFRDAPISASNKAVIPSGRLNNATISDMEVLRNSIDFTLARKGTTAFFAGTFQEGISDSFFSLHKVNRSGAQIISVEEILEIYRHKTDSSKPYIYKTSASNPSISSDYELAFATSWITNPSSLTEHRIYYFEIPLNAGEYAMGSISSKSCAFLMYFDIGTAGSDGDTVITGYSITTNASSIAYPIGVDFNVTGASVNGGGSFCVYISSNESGSVTFAIESEEVEITDDSEITTYAFQSGNFDVTFDVTGDPPGDLADETTVTTKVIYAFITTAAGVNHTVVITNGTGFVGDGVTYNTFEALNNAIPDFAMANYNAINNLSAAVTLTKTGVGPNFNVTPEYLVSDRTNIIITMDVTGVSVTASDIDDYTIYKNSVSQQNKMVNNGVYNF